MFLRFDDTNHDTTRRTMVFYALLAVTVHHYQPTIPLTELFNGSIEFGGNQKISTNNMNRIAWHFFISLVATSCSYPSPSVCAELCLYIAAK